MPCGMATTTATTRRRLYKLYDLFGQQRNETRRDAQYNNKTENGILNYTYRGCYCLCFFVIVVGFRFLS